MLGVLSAEGTILAALKLIGSILLILDGIVVSLLALVASQRDLDSVVSHTFSAPPILFTHVTAWASASLCEIGGTIFGAKVRTKKDLSSDR